MLHTNRIELNEYDHTKSKHVQKHTDARTHTHSTNSSILAVAHAISTMYTKCNNVVIVVEIAHAAQNTHCTKSKLISDNKNVIIMDYNKVARRVSCTVMCVKVRVIGRLIK